MAKKTNCTKNGFDYYRVTTTIGFDNKGKRIRKEFLGKSKKEAQEKRDNYLKEIHKGLDAGYDKIEFGSLFEEWFEVVHRPTLSNSSYSRYETIHRLWIKQGKFYNIKLVSLKSMDIQKHINSIESADTAKRVYLLLSTFFRYCLKERLITFSPLDNVNVPKIEYIESVDDSDKCLSREEISKLMAAYKEDHRLLLYVFVLYTGLRKGELCALTHEDINFDTMTINISKTLNRVALADDNGIRRAILQINPPKSKAGIRVIPMPKTLVRALKEHILEEKKKHLQKGVKFMTSNFLFTSNTCTPLRDNSLTKRWYKLQAKLDIEPLVKFHGLRHTFCTLLAREGVPLKTAAKLMGHAKVETTARVYTHVDKKAKEDAMDILERVIK